MEVRYYSLFQTFKRESESAVHWKRGKKQAVLEDFKENIKKAERRMMKKSEK